MISIQTALLRLSLALVLGAIVGLERERGERSAGLLFNERHELKKAKK